MEQWLCYLLLLLNSDYATVAGRSYRGSHQLIWGLSSKFRKFKSLKKYITPIQKKKTPVFQTVLTIMGQRKKKYMKTIGCHFVLPVHKQHNNLNHTMIIEENIVATKYYTNISKHHFETIFSQQNPQGTLTLLLMYIKCCWHTAKFRLI